MLLTGIYPGKWFLRGPIQWKTVLGYFSGINSKIVYLRNGNGNGNGKMFQGELT